MFFNLNIACISAYVSTGNPDTSQGKTAPVSQKKEKEFQSSLPMESLADVNHLSASLTAEAKMYVYNHTRHSTGNNSGEKVISGSQAQQVNVSNPHLPVYLISRIRVIVPNGVAAMSTKSSLQLSATIFPYNASDKTVNWLILPGGTGSATINSNGVLTSYKSGSIIVRAMAEDGSGIYRDIKLMVNPKSGLSFQKIGSNVYKTYNFGRNIGVWMIENLREGTPDYISFAKEDELSKGYLYSHSNAKKICPSGWNLPSEDEWNRLRNYMNHIASAEEKNMWITENSLKESVSGADGKPVQNVQKEQDTWWNSSAHNTFSLGNSEATLIKPSPFPENGLSAVRCIRRK
jgi:uncharacterized protein (TIGR02145 family)